MGMNLEKVLTDAKEGNSVHITLVSNQNNGIASYAEGSLIFHKKTGGEKVGGPPLRPAYLESVSPLKMFFSDRRFSIDPPSAGGFGITQPFDANQTEVLGVSVNTGFGDHKTISVSIKVFGKSVKFDMERLGDLYVGVGPSLSESTGAVFVLAFTGVIDPPK